MFILFKYLFLHPSRTESSFYWLLLIELYLKYWGFIFLHKKFSNPTKIPLSPQQERNFTKCCFFFFFPRKSRRIHIFCRIWQLIIFRDETLVIHPITSLFLNTFCVVLCVYAWAFQRRVWMCFTRIIWYISIHLQFFLILPYTIFKYLCTFLNHKFEKNTN